MPAPKKWHHALILTAVATLPAAAVLLVTTPHAQKSGSKVGIVNVQQVLAAAPGGAGLASLRKQVDADLKKQADGIRALQQKVATGGATPADRQALQTALQTYNAAGQRYQKQLQERFAPVSKTVNGAVSAAAKAQGYNLVLDYTIAQQSGLVIYADVKNTDLTQAVIKQLKK